MFDEQRPRRVVPRWRSSLLTAQTAEAKVAPPKTRPNFDVEVSAKQAEFMATPSVPIASEMMFLANQTGDQLAARRAAQVIVDAASTIGSVSLVAAAKRVLGASDVTTLENPTTDFVREARKILTIDYRNPILLMDIARALTAKGHEQSAKRYVRAAVSLAPNSRFIVRAAARYYLHVGKNDIAHDILKKSPLLQHDSWIQASEIAVATVIGRTSVLPKSLIRATTNLKSVPPHLSELASAVATNEFLSGSTKTAKKLFQMALIHPNDNSLAQAEWAARKLNLVVDEVALRTPLSFEANSNNAYRRLLLPEAIDFARQWADDEPFASRPYDALCYFYCLEGSDDKAKVAAEKAFAANGGNSLPLQMNLLFVNIQSGSLDLAYTDLLKLSRHQDAKKHAPHLLANAGALAYAVGESVLAKDYYQRAIAAARRAGEPGTEALARAFFARAAAQYGDPSAQEIILESTAAAERMGHPGAIYVVRSLVNSERRKALELAAAKRVAKRRWEWDAATNTLSRLG